ncbi:MAG: molybdate ABC transporter substrate-binding protein, partial [Desulfuromonadales bacterium]|nr:molybdate ABC transporter substrate-binding protein [Desulfuromonadales bacterium]NIS42444.1 molybdate ABC transporter substrate-binding protein [Desulfuromonadales bacterium]
MRSFLAALFLLSTLNAAFAAEVRLSVAASMTDAARQLVAAFEKRTKDVDVLANFAASGALARQIARGAPADIFISADPRWMHHLDDLGEMAPGKVRPLARNSLVFVGRKGLPVDILPDIVRLERIALGSPQSVPAGRYAVQSLKNAGLHQRVREKLVMAKDVRQALVYAERGAADGAFVYRTDARLAR